VASLTFDSVVNTLQKIGMTRFFIGLGAGIGVLLVLVMLAMRVGKPSMTALYQGIDPEDSAKVLEHLGGQGIPFEVRDGGIFVPSSNVLRARMSLAEAGVSGGTLVGYEIFDKTDVLGSTHFVQNVNLLRALEGELSRTIQTINTIAQARVHIVMPERHLFSKEKRKPSAAVVVRSRAGRNLSAEQVSAIRHLVASSVPDLNTDQVSLLDDRGKLLAADRNEGHRGDVMKVEEMRDVYEARLGRMIESMLEQSLGAGSVRVEVSAEIDLDRVTEQSEKFDPEGQVVRSQQNVNDSSRSSSGGANPTSVQQELPNLQQGGGGQNKEGSEAQKNEETTNYEISKTVRTAVKEMGGVRRLSVAVLVDGVHAEAEGGEETYKERPDDELQKIKRLVQAAMGYKEARGDVVDVVNMRFKRHNGEGALEDPSWWPSFTQEHVMRLAEMILLAIVVLVLFFFGVKPLLMPKVTAHQVAEKLEEGSSGSLTTGSEKQNSNTNAPLEAKNITEDSNEDKALRGWEKMPDDELLAVVNKFIKADPERATSILRVWMKE